MRRIAIIADSHYRGTSRFEECCAVHEWIAHDIAAREVDLVVHTGDVFDTKSTAEERNAFADFLADITRSAPILIVRGNHDFVGDLEIFQRLDARRPIIVEEKARVHVVNGIAVAAVAWPRKAELLATMGAQGQELGEQAAGDALRTVLRGLGAHLAEHDGPRLLAMHAMVRGSMTSTGQPLVGCDMELGLEDLALCRADAYALGHIHKGQEWEIEGRPVIYPGSPRRTAFGETERKGYVIVEVDDINADTERRRPATWELVETPCAPMVLVEADVTPAGLLDFRSDMPTMWADWPRGAEVRFRYRVSADAREAARVRAAEWATTCRDVTGAAFVKVEEEVIPVTRSRAPELARTATLTEQLATLRASRGERIPEERVERLNTKTLQIEEELQHAS